MHNGSFQVLTLFSKSSNDATPLTLGHGGTLFQIFAASYRSESFPYFMVLNLYNGKVFVSRMPILHLFSFEICPTHKPRAPAPGIPFVPF